MNIQSISFGAKHRPNYHRPMLPKNNSHAPNATLEQAIKKYEQTIKEDRTTLPWAPDSRIDTPTMEELREIGQNALNAIPMIENAAAFAQNKTKNISWEAKQIQAQTEKLAAKVKETQAWQDFVVDEKSYTTEVKLDKKIYDVEIYANGSAKAIERVTREKRPLSAYEAETFGRDVYKFDVKTGTIGYFAQEQKEYNGVTSSQKEFNFDGGLLYEYNEGASRGEFELIPQQFRFYKDGSLTTFATMSKESEEEVKILSGTTVVGTKKEKRKTSERFFVFDKDGTLNTFANGVTYFANGSVKAEKLYDFDEKGKVKTLELGVKAWCNYYGKPFNISSSMFKALENKRVDDLNFRIIQNCFAQRAYDKYSKAKIIF